MLISCNSSTEKKATIRSLELALDSLTENTNERNAGFKIADSLLKYDPTNSKALSIKATKYFNDRQPAKAIPLFKKALRFTNEASKDYVNTNLICLGWSYEQMNNMDSARKYYEITLNRIDSTWETHIGEPHLKTILYGKEEGLKSLESYTFGEPYYKEQTKNDIELYSGGGLSEFMPSFFGTSRLTNYYVIIPDSLYDNGIINTRLKVLLFYAQLGVNITVTTIDTPNKGYRFYTSEKYVERLEKLDTLNLERL